MRVLQVSPTLYPTLSFGGGSIVAWELGAALVRKGHSVSVISTDAGDSGRTPRGKSSASGMNVIRARNLSNSLAYKFKLFIPLTSPRAMRAEVRGSDIVHLHDFRTVLDLEAAKMAMDGGVPLVVQPHGTIRSDYLGRRSLKGIVDLLAGRRIASEVDAWIALSEIEREQLMKFGIPAAKIRVLPNGIDVDQFRGRIDKWEARKRLGMTADEKLLLFIGRIHEIKGLGLLIDAMNEISAREKGLTAVIAGPDDGALPGLKEKVRKLGLSDRVMFRGMVAGDEKMALMSAADAFVLPSEKEAFPISLLEACAMGLPVISTDNSDIAKEMDGICGLTVRRDAKELSEAIARIMRDRPLAEKLASAGREYSLRYSWDTVVTGYVKLYESLRGKGAAGH